MDRQEEAKPMVENAGENTVTTIPRWTAPSITGHGAQSYRALVPWDLADALRRTVGELGVAPGISVLLLAAHARVLATVADERDLLIGCMLPEPPHDEVQVHLTVGQSTWADLVTHAAGAMAGARRNGARPESVLDLSGLAAGPVGRTSDHLRPGTVVRVAWERADDGLTLHLSYDSGAIDQTYAERFAGYHITALRWLVAGPGDRHDRQSLLSPAEASTQLYGLAGPRAELPGVTFADLFSERVRAAPGAIAAVHGEQRWTYAHLDERANRVAQALLAAGSGAEDVVAVVMHRTLDWISAALGVFKAGGVYLPVAPDFPAGRVATQLNRSKCRFVLSEPGSEELARQASAIMSEPPGVLSMSEIQTSTGPVPPSAVSLAPRQAAYIYFTSGSTGEPKGALCEHAGMLNHLYMKVEDLGMREGPNDVVAQTASQCFDISLWQFAAPLLIGGTVRIIDTDTQLDIAAFLDALTGGGVTVAQVVPSYLELLLTHLEQHPRDLGALRILSVTGELLKYDLVQRWFAAQPQVKLANAYGATEVSDDTMHEILDKVPERDFVTVGRSLRNVSTYILDQSLNLVPLGSVGEIAFSGVCVGRGYINDEERTREAFTFDPFRPDTRMYRTGDYGRWLPEGRIEYRGRRDEQIKIDGFRIEIGEIENKLLAIDGIREAALVIDRGSGESRNLVAFFSGDGVIAVKRVREVLSAQLPSYMMPTYFHQIERLPLTENGKIDKKALGNLARTLGHAGAAYAAPASASEQRLAMLWSEVLGTPLERIGRADSFFELGGTSLAAVRLLVSLDRKLSLKDLAAQPVLADLAATLDDRELGGPRQASGLLQQLAPVRSAHHTLVCFPYAGGNAVNFRSLAVELARDGIAVLGVEPPGHDFTDSEPPADVPTVARQVRDELAKRAPTPVVLWGHCAGAAAALETARLLEADGTPAERVFVGALLLDSPLALAEENAEVTAADTHRLLDRMRADNAYTDLDTFKPERAEVAGRAYRHDVLTSNNHLLRVHQDPATHRIGTPVDVVVARDDTSTAHFGTAYGNWKAVSGLVTLHVLEQGGHSFVCTRPADAAELVRAACLSPGRTGTGTADSLPPHRRARN
jgi:amino acid adenylation domain-containing protein